MNDDSDDDIVVDASAVLAVLKDEPFGDFDSDRISGAYVSAVNYSEVLAKSVEGGFTATEAVELVSGLRLRVIAFDEDQAREAARLREATRAAGLSLGDRACLALALALKAPAVTADRAWGKLSLEAKIVVIR